MHNNQFKQAKIDEIQKKIAEISLYQDLLDFLKIQVNTDFIKAESVLESVDIGSHFVKIVDPNPNVMDFFYKKGFRLKFVLPAYEGDAFTYNVTAWLESNHQ